MICWRKRSKGNYFHAIFSLVYVYDPKTGQTARMCHLSCVGLVSATEVYCTGLASSWAGLGWAPSRPTGRRELRSYLLYTVYIMCGEHCTMYNVKYVQVRCTVYTYIQVMKCLQLSVHLQCAECLCAMGGTYAALCSSGTLLHCTHLAENSSLFNAIIQCMLECARILCFNVESLHSFW